MTTKTMIRKTIKKVVKTIALEVASIDDNNKHVTELVKIEKAFKKAYRITKNVRYVDVKAKGFITKPNVRGYHADSEIVVFLDGNLRKNAETLLHELTHAYQAQHMTRQFKASKQQMKSGQVSYKDSWHETHARHCAKLLINTLDFSLDLHYALDYVIAA